MKKKQLIGSVFVFNFRPRYYLRNPNTHNSEKPKEQHNGHPGMDTDICKGLMYVFSKSSLKYDTRYICWVVFLIN